MALEGMDFQALVHQQIAQLVEQWRSQGLTDEEIQENATQLANFGFIAAQQVEQQGGIQVAEGTEPTPYTPVMAEQTIELFLQGINAAAMKAREIGLPVTEKWQLMQNVVALYIFEQTKHAIMATLGQEATPDIQISKEQLYAWLNQTGAEALMHYVTEHEKQFGPIPRINQEPMFMPEGETSPGMFDIEPDDDSHDENKPKAVQEATSQPVAKATNKPTPVPDNHHKYAAVGLMLSSLPVQKQTKILSAFQPEEQELIQQYRNPDIVAQQLDLNRVNYYLQQFKDTMGAGKAKSSSRFSSPLTQMIAPVPKHRLERLFHKERPLLQRYIQDLTQPDSADTQQTGEPVSLPAGVEESLIVYLHRSFPNEVSVS